MTNQEIIVFIAREYLRVSNDKTGRMRSPEEQHADNERAATELGWPLGTPYVENGAVSASRYSHHKSRPGFAALVADLEAGTFGAQVLILWEPSRGSRRLSEWVRLLELLEDWGVLLHVTSHGRTYDLANARDRRSLHEDGTDAEYESAKVSQRVTRAMAARAAAGEPHGRTAYGYRREYRLNGNKREITGQVRHTARAAVVERIFTDIGRGVSLRAIAARLNMAGVASPGGRQWTPQGVRDLALNPAYAGLRLHAPGRRSGHDRSKDGTLTPGTWPAIVPPETWYATRDLLTDPRRRTARPGRDKHLLSMIAVCAVCGSALTVRYKRGRAEYACRGRGCVRVVQDDLDGLVQDTVLGFLATPGEYPHVTRRDTSAELQAARDDLAAARAFHKDLTGALTARRISVMAFADAELAALKDIEAAEARVRSLEAPTGLATLGLDPGADIAARWQAAPMTARREVVRLLLARVALGRSGPGQRIPAAERVSIEWRE
jgi:DNA invertase Pin-like site-specific DNA recombinase